MKLDFCNCICYIEPNQLGVEPDYEILKIGQKRTSTKKNSTGKGGKKKSEVDPSGGRTLDLKLRRLTPYHWANGPLDVCMPRLAPDNKYDRFIAVRAQSHKFVLLCPHAFFFVALQQSAHFLKGSCKPSGSCLAFRLEASSRLNLVPNILPANNLASFNVWFLK